MKKFFTIAILALTVNAFAQIPTNGLVGYWPFNGNANDESGNGNNGTVVGATLTSDRFGNTNSAYSFNGTSNLIDIGVFNTMNASAFSTCFFIKTSAQYAPLFTNRQIPASDQCNTISIDNGKIDFRVDIENQYLTPCYSNTLINTDDWFHVCCVRENDVFSIYINGVLESSTSGNQTVTTTSSNFHFGHHGAWEQFYGVAPQSYLNGILDDIRIYDRALTPQEISNIYNENICYVTITVTDTLIINANLTNFNPVTYQNSIKIFPNPTNDQITIDFGNNYSTMNGYILKITNSLSQIVYSTSINTQTTTVDLSTWTGNGIYFVHLIDASSNTIDIRKIVLQ